MSRSAATAAAVEAEVEAEVMVMAAMEATSALRFLRAALSLLLHLTSSSLLMFLVCRVVATATTGRRAAAALFVARLGVDEEEMPTATTHIPAAILSSTATYPRQHTAHTRSRRFTRSGRKEVGASRALFQFVCTLFFYVTIGSDDDDCFAHPVPRPHHTFRARHLQSARRQQRTRSPSETSHAKESVYTRARTHLHSISTMMTLAARLGQQCANTRVTPSAGDAVRRCAHRCVSSAGFSTPPSSMPSHPQSSSSRPTVQARSFRVSAARWTPPDPDDKPETEPTNTQALIDAMGQVSKATGRDAGGKVTTVMGDGVGGLGSNLSWEELDEKVNTYPSDRKFQAIGEGGDAFVAEIVGLVQGALGRDVKPENVTSRRGEERERGRAEGFSSFRSLVFFVFNFFRVGGTSSSLSKNKLRK